MTVRLLLTGYKGQVGHCLLRQAQWLGWSVLAVDRDELDITDKLAVLAQAEAFKPHVIINAAAHTAVDKAETDSESSYAINRDGPAYLAQAAVAAGAVMLHISTDYVFSGDKTGLYVESDPVNPQGVYGASKLAGERVVAEHCARHLILRTAWVFGEHGNNFVKTMLELAAKHPQLTVVNDQVGSPTSTVDLAAAIIDLIETDHYGIYHGTCEGQCSWYDFALEIFRLSGIDIPVAAVTSEQFVRPAPRPKYSVLENKASMTASSAQ